MHCNEKYCFCLSNPLIRCGGFYAFDSQIMEETILYHGRITSSSIREAPSASNDGWRSIYTLRDAKSCVNKIQAVRYRENIVGVSYRLKTISFILLHAYSIILSLLDIVLYHAYHSLQLGLFSRKCELVS